MHWGYFSKNLKPAVEVQSADFVTIETLTHHANEDAERMVKGGAGKGTGMHICTGPGPVMAVAVDFGVAQVVDGNWGVHAIVKKAIFSGSEGSSAGRGAGVMPR